MYKTQSEIKLQIAKERAKVFTSPCTKRREGQKSRKSFWENMKILKMLNIYCIDYRTSVHLSAGKNKNKRF